MFTFLHAADIHLDSPLKGLERYDGAPVDAIRLATRTALDNLVDLAVDEQAAFVLIAGDIYDGDWKDHNTGRYFIRAMSKLGDAGIRAVVVQGNHDAQSVVTKHLKLPPNVRMLATEAPETVRFDDWGVTIHGQGYRDRDVTDDLSRSYPAADRGRFNIGILHTCAEDNGIHGRYAPCTVADLRSKAYDYWALGHVHTRADLQRAGDAPIVFPGNLQGRHIREPGAKGCVVVRVDDRGRAEHHFRRLDVFRWESCAVDADGAVDDEDLLERLAARLGDLARRCDGLPLAARVEFTGACRAHRSVAKDPHAWAEQVRSAAETLGGGRIWVEKVRLLTRTPDAPAPDADGPIAELISVLAELRDDPEALARFGRAHLGELFKKVKPEIGPEVDDPGRLRDALDGAGSILLGRLGVEAATS